MRTDPNHHLHNNFNADWFYHGRPCDVTGFEIILVDGKHKVDSIYVTVDGQEIRCDPDEGGAFTDLGYEVKKAS